MFNNGELSNLYKEVITNNAKISSHYDTEGMRKLLSIHNPEKMNQDHSNTLFRILVLE